MAIGMEKLIGLEPIFKRKVKNVVIGMENRGWNIRIVWGKRTKKENDELVTKGVASKTSKHLPGKAVDLIDRKVGYSINRNHPYYKNLAELSKKEGLIWGGNFTQRWDPCHIEKK